MNVIRPLRDAVGYHRVAYHEIDKSVSDRNPRRIGGPVRRGYD